MTDLSYLDTLSNKELHAKCREYGLPNTPVTDSSRQVIMRRLRAEISGVPLNKSKSAAAKTTKRETRHSINSTPAGEISTRNATTAAKSPIRNSNNNRRTIAVTPSEYYPLANSSVRSVETTTTVSDVGSQSEDDDYDQYRSAHYQRDEPHLRRSVSLTKSGVLTTSYTREVQQPEHENEVDHPQSQTYHRPQVATAQPRIERSYAPALARQSMTQTPMNSTSYSGQPLSLDAGEAAYSIRQRQTIGESGVARGRLLQPTYKVNSLYPQLNEFYDPTNIRAQPMDVDSDSDEEPETQRQQRLPGGTIESPYLSHFSRQLDTQKRSSPLARPQMRSSIQQLDPNSPMQQLRTFLGNLNRQYHLKFYFYLTVAVMLATLVYVVLT